jgi:ATP-dependent exoDNAse (exonuclease V) alpha subunit
MFARLTAEPNALVLEGHHRQQRTWERDALMQLRAGDVAAALEAYRKHERLHTHHDPERVRDEAVAAYIRNRAEQPEPWQTVLLASKRDDVRDLNERVRTQLHAAGKLGKGEIAVETDDAPIGFRRGEQVLVTRNDHARGLLNGTAAIVTALHPDGVTMQTASGRQVRVDQGWLREGRLDHGYAMTLHKAQGRTVHTALVVGSDTLSAQAGYVGLSRGTRANHLFVSTRDLHDLTTDCGGTVQHRPSLPSTRPALLRRDSRQRLALEQLRRGDRPPGLVHNSRAAGPAAPRAS